MRTSVVCFLFLLFAFTTQAQTNVVVSGSVKNASTNEPVASASVLIKGSNATGTFTDEKGNFKLSAKQNPPFTLVISSVGFATQEIPISNATEPVNVSLQTAYVLGQDVVVSASRTPERILESPVTIQRVSAANIAASPASTYYDVIGNLNGVDLTTSSLTFKTPSTRGFNGSGNVRFNQLVDGMDNQAPGLNFPVGAIVGPTELDVDNMELLNGASSALYGPGGMNGTLLISSKDPFKYQGLSVQIKGGVNHINDYSRSASPYYDFALRFGKKISDKFAFKISGEYIEAKDWVAHDTSNFLRSPTSPGKLISGTRASDANYNGVNVYGDETSLNITNPATPFLQSVAAAINQTGIPATAILSPYFNSSLNVSRTGYKESDVIDPTTRNIKASGGLYYMITPSTELSFIANLGYGTSVYTGSDRYSLKNFMISQYKLEARSKNWFLRAYTTQEDAGQSFNATVTMQLFNEAWKPSFNGANAAASWYPQFTGAFAQGALTTYLTAYQAAISGPGATPATAAAAAQSVMQAHTQDFLNGARAYADAGRPVAGTAAFKTIFDQVRSKPIPQGGLFVDHTALYMAEGQYNLTNLLNIDSVNRSTDVLIGGNYKRYELNSKGTLFIDTAGKIPINEYGAYLQLQQRLFHDVLKLTASGRYDKNDNFKGNFTPRISAVISVAKNHNIRLSYQTAYRFPTTQQQYINLNIGGGTELIGGLPLFRKLNHFDTNPIYTLASYGVYSSTPASIPKNTSLLVVQQLGEFKPETCASYEVGYKGLIANKLLIDVYGYYSEYKNFLGRIYAVQSSTVPLDTVVGLANPKTYSIAVNSTGKVKTDGWGVAIQYLLPHNFNISANLFSDELKSSSANFETDFNTPKYRANIGFGNTGFLAKNAFGFNVVYRWQDKFFYEGDFTSGNIGAFGTLDAQLTYKLSQSKILLKLGGTNLTNHYYINAYGNPSIGGLYYVSATLNIL